MRSILHDETTLATPLDRMSITSAFTWILIIFGGLLVSAIISFIPPNTSIVRSLSPNYPQGESLISHRSQFESFTPLSGFAYLYITPSYDLDIKDNNEKNLSINIKGHIKFLDDSLNEYSSISLNKSTNIICSRISCRPPISIYETNLVDFSAVSVYADVECNFPGLTTVTFWSLSLRTSISITGCFFIVLFTILVSLLLLFVVPNRFRPSTGDHWATLFLGIALILVDGPWLIMRYYIPGFFSQFFDIAPDLFHVAFLLFVTFFVAARTLELPHRIFGSKIIKISITLFLVLTIAVQFYATNFMPLSTISLYIDEKTILKYSIYIFNAVYHIAIICLLIFGILSLQIESFPVLILVSFAFFILEIIEIVRNFVRFLIPIEQIGFTFATDVFYILMANVGAFFFLASNLPNGFNVPASSAEIESQVIDVIPVGERL